MFFGDVAVGEGTAIVKDLQSAEEQEQQKIKFVCTDAASYADNLDLFDIAYRECGRVDHAISAAGISDRGNIADLTLTLESVRQAPTENLRTMDVCLLGPLYFSRIASVYLRQSGTSDRASNAGLDKSLTLVSSVAGFTEAPGLTVYSAAKHGVLGLMRSLRRTLCNASPHAVRTNAICPWYTETRLVHGVRESWDEAGLPKNSPLDVAKIIAGESTCIFLPVLPRD